MSKPKYETRNLVTIIETCWQAACEAKLDATSEMLPREIATVRRDTYYKLLSLMLPLAFPQRPNSPT